MTKTKTHQRRRVATAILATLGVAASALTAPQAHALTIDPGTVPGRTTVAIHNDNGTEYDTPGAHAQGPAESLAKLLLAHWVLRHGVPADKALVDPMIRLSDDGIATHLDHTYPNAIRDVVNDYHLTETTPGAYWGATSTSMHDIARFVQELRRDPGAAPIINAMAGAAPVASDGYAQNYGTATIPGVWATKFGWADDGSINTTVSIGPDYVIAARTHGPAHQLTDDLAGVRAAAAGGAVTAAPGAVGGAPSINVGSSSVPGIYGSELKARLAPSDPLGLRNAIPDAAILPRF